jgi:hypothetical protein
MKNCSKCKEKLDLSFFHKSNKSKDGLKSECKICSKKYNDSRKDIKSKKDKEYYERTKEKRLSYRKKYYEENKEKCLKTSKEWTLKNKEKKNSTQKIWNNNNKEKVAEIKKRWVENNPEKLLKIKERLKKIKVEREKERIKQDSIYRFKIRTRANISKSFKRISKKFSKKSKTEEILGCSIKEFRDYIESKFTEGMTFKNYGKWHLDHIIPIASAKTECDVINLCHYTNYQPLWAEDNLKKGSKT